LEGVSVTGPAFIEKAQSMYNDFGIKGAFNVSSDWLTCFKYQHGISVSRTQSVEDNADVLPLH
jgi:hypothetical protein